MLRFVEGLFEFSPEVSFLWSQECVKSLLEGREQVPHVVQQPPTGRSYVRPAEAAARSGLHPCTRWPTLPKMTETGR